MLKCLLDIPEAFLKGLREGGRPAPTNPKKVRTNGWIQGEIISPEPIIKYYKKIIPLSSKNCNFFLVVSQDCDVIHNSYQKEPYIELLGVTKAIKLDGSLLNGRNPRIIQFDADLSGTVELFEASIHNKFRIGRELLEVIKPDQTIRIEKKIVFQIVTWIAKRYIRPAFPDEFINRISSKNNHIHKLLKSGGAFIETLYLELNSSQELPATENYKIKVIAAISKEYIADDSKMAAVQLILNKIVGHLTDCAGIEVGDGSFYSKKDLSLEDLDYLFEWDFDYLSNMDNS